jgi:hypothetical protein
MSKGHIRALAILIGLNAFIVIGFLAGMNRGGQWPPERSAIIELAGSLIAAASFAFFTTFSQNPANAG